MSSPGSVTCGVPQGSILGPLLFILYINNLPFVIKNCETFLYADDTAIIATGRDEVEITLKLNEAMNAASLWLNNNKLSLNVSKTKCMYIGTNARIARADFPSVSCMQEIIEEVDHFKYLGVVLDKSLSFDKHTNYIKRKVFVRMKCLARIRTFITEKLAVQLYKSLIIPHIDYGDVVYDAASKRNCKTLQVIQNGCLWVCCKADPRTPIVDLHRKVNIPTLSMRRAAHATNMVYNGLNGKSTNGINDMFQYVRDTHDVNTRSSSNSMVKTPVYRLAKTQGNMRLRGAVYYNKLPQHVRNATSIDSFKSRVKAHNITILDGDTPIP